MNSTLSDFNEKELVAQAPEKLLTDAEHAAQQNPREQDPSAKSRPEAPVINGPDQIEIARQMLMETAARQTAESQSASAERYTVHQPEAPEAAHYSVGPELKKAAYRRLLNRARKPLNPVQKVFSYVVHQPVIDSLSQVSAQTIARPSGLIGGGLVACLGSLVTLIAARRYGFSYNYLAFFWLLVGGFGAGIAVELLFKARSRSGN